MKLINTKIEESDSFEDTACTICYSYISNVILDPCHHKLCVSCSIKINKCHICRKYIEKREKLF